MINEENLNKMYNGLIDEKELTTKELNSYGFNSKDLTDLINDRVLERVKRGYYSFLSIDDLFYYGKQLIASKEYDKATACFKKCYDQIHSKLPPRYLANSCKNSFFLALLKGSLSSFDIRTISFSIAFIFRRFTRYPLLHLANAYILSSSSSFARLPLPSIVPRSVWITSL